MNGLMMFHHGGLIAPRKRHISLLLQEIYHTVTLLPLCLHQASNVRRQGGSHWLLLYRIAIHRGLALSCPSEAMRCTYTFLRDREIPRFPW